ncbi:hypothetical protein T310_8476 [Rasamsonia emersonii CBS 393.64]|uniref:N-acetyltransferase domain-containing protein n=1 Tax=Rasamsonia emersonii (strain ATCC 16479 / CBS 393.64 / IMI 116815) TaxID=1408163 RepID=A0A0F4YI90_RASE3|nr:hypothetical protein T310_8476 [Rasamsonia emersonii CBS 393.64]KKA17586.1 hypothetical protein T310_8476 [Rasamsonia emersonii CBS 393.64]
MAYPSPTFSISTQCLHISHFLPDSPKHCAFLARLYNTDDFIQSCGRTGIDTPDKAARFLQTRVAADFAPTGTASTWCLASPAAALMQYARRELGVEAVLGFCDPENARSRRVLEKIGLEFRGVRGLRVFGGRSSAVYALPEMSLDLKTYGVDD